MPRITWIRNVIRDAAALIDEDPPRAMKSMATRGHVAKLPWILATIAALAALASGYLAYRGGLQEPATSFCTDPIDLGSERSESSS